MTRSRFLPLASLTLGAMLAASCGAAPDVPMSPTTSGVVTGAAAAAADPAEAVVRRWGRHGDGGLHPGEGPLFAAAEFAEADQDHDGRLTPSELRTFFAGQARRKEAAALRGPRVASVPDAPLDVILAGYLAFAGVKGAAVLMHPARQPDTDTPAAHGWAYQPVQFTAADGVELHGWAIPAAVPTSTWVVALHGYGGNRASDLGTHVPLLHQAYNVLQFDFRGHGDSGGTFTTIGYFERQDVVAAVAFAKAQLHAGKIGVWGISMGGSTGLEACANLPDVACMVDDCGFATLQEAIQPRAANQGYPFADQVAWAIRKVMDFELGVHVEDADPIAWVGRFQRPLLIIHGTADTETLPVNSQELFDAAAQPKSLWWVPGATHGQAEEVDPMGYAQHVQAFFARYL